MLKVVRDTVKKSMSRGHSVEAVLTLALLAVFAMLVGSPSDARADDGPSVEFLQSKLKSDDFRVRFNAALALGGKSGGDDHPKAVASLCDALGDEKEAVRTAIASALKRLNKPSALQCLRSRLSAEPSNDVKLGITRAIESIEASGGSGSGGGDPGGSAPPAANNPNAKYYFAYTISNNTGRSQGEIETLVLRPMRAKLDGAGTFQYARPAESPDEARKVLKDRKLSGLYLSVAVDMSYVDDPTNGLMLKVKLRIAVSSYPGKALKGSFDKGVSQAVGRRGDKATEDNLLSTAAALAFDQFAQNAQMFL